MRLLVLLTSLISLTVASPSLAQPSRGAVELQTPVLAEQDDGTALAANPAQVPLLRGWNLTYLSRVVTEGPTAGQGHGLFFSMPLPLGLGWGASVELVRPEGADSAWRSPFTLALGWQWSRRLSIGVASRWFFSSADPALNGLWAVDLGVTARLSPLFAVAVTAHSINDPRPHNAIMPNDIERFGRQWSLGMVLRPTGRDHLSLAAEVTYAEQWERLTVRGVASVRPLAGWTIRADVSGWFEEDDSGLDVTLSMELALSMFTLGGSGTLAGLEDGGVDFGGFSAMASVADDGHGVLWDPPRVVQLVLDDGPSTRSLAALERTLLRAAEDRSVRGVLLRPRSGFSASLAEIQDLRWVLGRVQRAGKQVACYLDDASGSGYFLCAGADRVLVNVAGGVRVSGLRMTTLYLGQAMDRLGVSFEMLRIGEYKSSPEQLTQGGPSEASQEQTNDYLSSIYRRWIWDLAHDREVSTERMIDVVDQGPYLAEEAVGAGLVDGAIFADGLDDELEELFGRRYRLDKGYHRALERRRGWAGGPSVAVIHIQGNLTDGEGFEAGPDWLRSVGARTLSRAISKARKNRGVKAMVLRIDSPGGSVLASDVIWRSVRRASEGMPVVASMGGVAASGGYYVASAADEIFAAPTTLTGSIGVFYGKFELSGLMEKLSIHPFHYRRGRHAGHNDWTRPWTEDERSALGEKVRTFYDRFLDRVVTGRDNFEDSDQVDRIARGRIWSGSRAKQLGLIDHIGGLQHAIERAAELAELDPDRYEVIHLPRPDRSLMERAVSWIGLRAGAEARSSTSLPPAVQKALTVAAPLVYAEPNTAQALLPYAVEISAD